MPSIKRLLSIFLLAFFVATPVVAAQAADIPLLTWERGRIQEVVLGGGAVQ